VIKNGPLERIFGELLPRGFRDMRVDNLSVAYFERETNKQTNEDRPTNRHTYQNTSQPSREAK